MGSLNRRGRRAVVTLNLRRMRGSQHLMHARTSYEIASAKHAITRAHRALMMLAEINSL